MKISNLIFVLALFLSFSLHGQTTSSRVVTVDDDNESIHIEYEDDVVTLLKIDGVTIDKSDYSTYHHIFDKYKYQEGKDSKSVHHSTGDSNPRNNMQTILLKKLKVYLSKDKNFNSNNFAFNLTSNSMKVNGKKLSKIELNDCLDIFDETAGYSLSKGSYFKVDIEPGSSSISLSIED